MNTPSSSDLSPARELEALADQHYAAGDFTRKHETYFEAYAGIFAGRRDQPLRILELGVHSGASLLIWRDYLPNATVVGLDIEPEPAALRGQPRIHFIQASQDDTAALDRAMALAGGLFDVIIDDASHIGYLTKRSIQHAFPRLLAPRGVYVIEDFGTAFRPEYPDGAPMPPPETFGAGTRYFPGHQYGMAGVVKQLIDDMMRELATGTGSLLPIGKITLVSNLAMIERLPGDPPGQPVPATAPPPDLPVEALTRQMHVLMAEIADLRERVAAQEIVLHRLGRLLSPLRRLAWWR